jgi:hypothetical protein
VVHHQRGISQPVLRAGPNAKPLQRDKLQ